MAEEANESIQRLRFGGFPVPPTLLAV